PATMILPCHRLAHTDARTPARLALPGRSVPGPTAAAALPCGRTALIAFRPASDSARTAAVAPLPAAWLDEGFGPGPLRDLQLGPQARQLLLQFLLHVGVLLLAVRAAQLVRVLLQVEQLPVAHVRLVEVHQLVARRHDAVVPADLVRARVLVVVVVEALA